MNMLMTVNPGIEVYLLDADGRVDAYIGEPGMVRRDRVALGPVRAFLAGAALPLRGTDPKTGRDDRIFSAAMFPPGPGDARPPGYLYIVLEGQARTQVAGPIGQRGALRSAGGAAGLALVATLAIGALVVRRLTRPLHALALRMRRFSVAPGTSPPERAAASAGGDEIATMTRAFDEMTRRIEHEVRAQAAQAAAHRELMANVAHDLRTPLTALHGHLEALVHGGTPQAPPGAAHAPAPVRAQRLLDAALAQSEKVRRLTQQLFELATLQATDQVTRRERFRLDELVADTVQKFELHAQVRLAGPAPGGVELDGDLQLIERALTNLIDNALRHAGDPVAVRLERDACCARIVVEDCGPGLPREIARRLNDGAALRTPPLPRPGGGVGGLGLAIAQRIAALHGGRLHVLPAPGGGARMGLDLPLQPTR
jgi:signal transduction histidine kinase